MNHASIRARWWLFDLQIPIGRNGEAEGQGTSRLYRIQCSSSSVDCIVQVRRKYFKGLLSIPCDGRGARRPLGQSFQESVGPASVKLSSGTLHCNIKIKCSKRKAYAART